MDLEYDRKFEDMKKYVPFLESMIRRLESTSTAASSNPRQAQLNKIRSLRDLLLDQKKRMKMVNLLKCEQVLVNLYAKVEQKDTLPGISKPVALTDSNRELNSVRKKLKSLTAKSGDDPDTLPEIARASETEAICTPGSKEPALFQRRPNLEVHSSPAKSPVKLKSTSRRSYTRVLVSPESTSKRWSPSKGDITDKALFSRRSPQQPLAKNSPHYHKKERRKSSIEKETRNRKDLNITLNVPEDSLDSLNTDDILSRIIHCSDSDVDISTLRELRSQILGELQKTGSSDDISDLILKSYKHKKKGAKSKEIEEGELSDSESEAIESVYGNLKIKDKGILKSNVTNMNKSKSSESDSLQRKIQICLVFNSDNEAKKQNEETALHETELEMFNNDNSSDKALESNDTNIAEKKPEPLKEPVEVLNTEKSSEIINTGIKKSDVVESDKKTETLLQTKYDLPRDKEIESCSKPSVGFKANFYKPLNEDHAEQASKEKDSLSEHNANISETKQVTSEGQKDALKSKIDSQTKEPLLARDLQVLKANKNQANLSSSSLHENKEKSEEIPLLGNDSKTVQMTSEMHQKSTQKVSEIDILQALKNDILSESIAIPGSEQTPALHQPKILKVANAKEITKKRISIEKYKAKSSNIPNTIGSVSKKSSLNLTEKEYERFNFSALPLDDISDEEAKNSKNISSYDIYGDLAPKSPDDNNDVAIAITPPVIIPDEPIKDKAVNLQSDVDMRKIPLLPTPSTIVKTTKSLLPDPSKNRVSTYTDDKYHRPIDPRMRQEVNRSVSIESPNPYISNVDRNRTLAPNQSYSNMTPNRTPLHQAYEIDNSLTKHVYAPLLSNSESSRENPENHLRRKISWETNPVKNDSTDSHGSQHSDPRSGKKTDKKQNSYSLSDSSPPLGHMINRSDWSEMPMTPSHPFGRSEMPQTANHPFGRNEKPMTPSHPFGRSEMPMTPSHPFGRSETQQTSSHPFGRTEMPLTPSHPFGRSEMPMTPSHPFGRSEMPMTPSHPFGRSEMPMTPTHPFGRGDVPMTPSHPFGRNPNQSFGRNDPRLNRSEQESKRNCDDKTPYIRESNYDGGKNFGRATRERSVDRGLYHDNVRDRRFQREHSIGRNDPQYQHDRSSDHNRFNRERSVGHNECETYDSRGRQYQRDYAKDRFSSRHRGEDDYKATRFNERHNQREKSVGRNTTYDESRYQRVSNAGQSYGERNKENTLSIERQSGRSFEIDTRVSSTFQNDLENEKTVAEKFDERRRRAASVGRGTYVETNISETDFLTRRQRASSVGRALKKSNHTFIDSNIQKYSKECPRKDLRRCSSVGRDLQSNRSEKSFSDIKADFALYQMQENAKRNKFQPRNSLDRPTIEQSRTKENIFKSKQVSNKLSPQINYSPRKNYRDPRMRREQQMYEKKNKHDKYRKDPYVNKNSGIVYSNDNIAKGAIMGPGYGVKNYKIPKIKRPADEEKKIDLPEADTKVEKTQISQNKTKFKGTNSAENQELLKKSEVNPCKTDRRKEDQTNALKKPNSKINDITSNAAVKCETQVTRPKISNAIQRNSKDTESPVTTRKNKKGVIYDTDSDSEQNAEKVVEKTTLVEMSETVSKQEEKRKIEEIKNNDEEEALLNNPEVLDSSFGIEDLDIFADNMVSDSNINAILADLDNDISALKSSNVDKDLQNNMEKLTKGPTLKEISNFIEEELNNSDASSKVIEPLPTLSTSPKNIHNNESSNETTLKNSQEVSSKVSDNSFKKSQIEVSSLLPKIQHLSQSKAEMPCQNIIIDTNSPSLIQASPQKVLNNDATVSTSDAKSSPKITEMEKNKSDSAVPDSSLQASNESKNVEQDGLPDSTNEISNENNTCISSTLKDVSKETQSSKDAIDSFGNLLTILQDKAKIQQLLSMLGDQGSDTEKIKKKLEKISEIVTDDEDTKDGEPQTDKTEKISSPTLSNDEKKVNSLEENEEKPKEDSTVSADVISSKNTVEDNILNIDSKIQKVDDKSPEQENETAEPVQGSNVTPSLEENVVTKKEKPKDAKKKGKVSKKTKGKREVKNIPSKAKRITRSTAAGKGKKKRGELQKLQDDIKEMFLSDEILNATGIRMCRLAKLLDEKPSKKDETWTQDVEPEPVVLLEKISNKEADTSPLTEKIKTKAGPKSKTQEKDQLQTVDIVPKTMIHKDPFPAVSYRPGPKSKTKGPISQATSDPYAFEIESSSTSTATIENHSDNSSDSENESLASSKSFGSTEPLIDFKKKKRKRNNGWAVGVIKPKNKKKPADKKVAEVNVDAKKKRDIDLPVKEITIPDLNCFTDKNYCFLKDVSTYSCRLCHYNGDEIINHYKKHHPHSEVPLSRMHPSVAKTAIQQCEEPHFQAISKLPTNKYVCRFCFKEFAKKKNILEIFFWHVVSLHTGEYKQICTECINFNQCPFNLDIPPPPKDMNGQLIGFICDKCNFTQISLENLKLHVILRHNDEQTAVYTINLADMTRGTINHLLKNLDMTVEKPEVRVLRSSLSSKSATESTGDERSDVTNGETVEKKVTPGVSGLDEVGISKTLETKISFENDDTSEVSRSFSEDVTPEVKDEPKDSGETLLIDNPDNDQIKDDNNAPKVLNEDPITPSDILNYPHFKINYTKTGSKEYLCCIKGDTHYRTPLLISFKKHVQKHVEHWDGYCFVCKVIITPQGKHSFMQLLQHFIDIHMDNFPVEENISPEKTEINDTAASVEPAPRTYINVRPLAQLLSPTAAPSDEPEEIQSETIPIIEDVRSLGSEPVLPIDAVPTTTFLYSDPPIENTQYEPEKYEEAQTEIMSKKHRVVLETMMTPDKLVRVFKCAGRFCSYTTDSTEEALIHASTHQRVGGENALKCAYCDFDSSGNAIDLVMHIFKFHAQAPFVCGHCFYRADASQLVGAHILRIHGPGVGFKKVLKSARPPLPAPDSGFTLRELKREEACLYYVCNNGVRNMSFPCKFKTFTPGKFIDHLLQRHTADNVYSCYLCSEDCAAPLDLIEHLKTHGLKRYQCLWCVFGAEDEPELLAHASDKHPWKPPQGYIRIVTNKEGSDEYRVLPKALLNKNKVPFVEVEPNTVVENATREAERSIDLEKLIGNLLTDPLYSVGQAISDPSAVSETQNETISVNPVIANVAEDPPPEDNLTASNSNLINTSDIPASSLKTEAPETPNQNVNSEVICLDSDEDDTPEQIKVVSSKLFKCAKCKNLCKTLSGFRRHLSNCYNRLDTHIVCFHCSQKVSVVTDLVIHIVKEHSIGDKYCCSICNETTSSIATLKKHMKQIHKIDKPVIKTQCKANHFINYGMAPPMEAKKSPIKRSRYGPLDIGQLPINPILDELVFCALCEFNTKVRLNMVRHLQQHAEQQPVAQTAPVNPVPHLETNEKYFDKMLNLASSSISNKTSKPESLSTAQVISPEAAFRYPKYIPDRQRYACGAKGCSYISVDEGMFKCHWETLHNGVNEFTCLHCPPNQHLDPNKPLNALRIITHLKMHDASLYACSSCPYYHFKRTIVEKHVNEHHTKKGCQVMIVREENALVPLGNTTISQLLNAPTMDLKPWQCGLCQFKSMLRQEINDHCYKIHQSKMQYKCSHCPYRASTVENVIKHQTNSHPDKDQDIFYYYYREGMIPNEADGTPRWVKQKQKLGASTAEVKTEVSDTTVASKYSEAQKSATGLSVPISIPPIDLNLVKTELDHEGVPTLEFLCARFGPFCEPNGIKYKCPLCRIIMGDTKDSMRSHLYEELRYRKWACSICSYKAFHETGLTEHMTSEHKQTRQAVELPKDMEIELWVTKLLDHQESLIELNRQKLKSQAIQTVADSSKPQAVPTAKVPTPTTAADNSKKSEDTQLELHFGSFGAPVNMQFACPKCQFKTGDVAVMQDHLENELTKIRWYCSNCPDSFPNYHEAQFHCRVVHTMQCARPKEALRDAAVRAAWVSAVIASQKSSMNCASENNPSTSDSFSELNNFSDSFENSLLAVRYEERVPTPEEHMQIRRKRPANDDSEEERLHIDEHIDPRNECPHCNFKGPPSVVHNHIVRHFNLKPFSCGHCKFMDYKFKVIAHLKTFHPNLPAECIPTPIPPGLPCAPIKSRKKDDFDKGSSEDGQLLCLICEKQITEAETINHMHGSTTGQFAKKYDVVVKCGQCLALRKDVESVEKHFETDHKTCALNYAFYKIKTTSREVLQCGHCVMRFQYLMDLRNHHDSVHRSLQISYTTQNVTLPTTTTVASSKRKSTDLLPSMPVSKKTARKSTAKLPKIVARKSTTKLPLTIQEREMDFEEFSFYGTKPMSLDVYDNVTTMMPFCNTMMPFKLKQLSEILKINPIVLVEDVSKK